MAHACEWCVNVGFVGCSFQVSCSAIPWIRSARALLFLKCPVLSTGSSIQLKSPPSIIVPGGFRNRKGSCAFLKCSPSFLFAMPVGAYTFIGRIPLKSASMARPHGMVVIFVSWIPLHATIAVPRIVVLILRLSHNRAYSPFLDWLPLALKENRGFVRRMKSSNKPTLVRVDMPLTLSVAIFTVSILYRYWGQRDVAWFLFMIFSSCAPHVVLRVRSVAAHLSARLQSSWNVSDWVSSPILSLPNRAVLFLSRSPYFRVPCRFLYLGSLFVGTCLGFPGIDLNHASYRAPVCRVVVCHILY